MEIYFLILLKAGNPRSRCQYDKVLGYFSFWLSGGRFFFLLSALRAEER